MRPISSQLVSAAVITAPGQRIWEPGDWAGGGCRCRGLPLARRGGNPGTGAASAPLSPHPGTAALPEPAQPRLRAQDPRWGAGHGGGAQAGSWLYTGAEGPGARTPGLSGRGVGGWGPGPQRSPPRPDTRSCAACDARAPCDGLGGRAGRAEGSRASCACSCEGWRGRARHLSRGHSSHQGEPMGSGPPAARAPPRSPSPGWCQGQGSPTWGEPGGPGSWGLVIQPIPAPRPPGATIILLTKRTPKTLRYRNALCKAPAATAWGHAVSRCYHNSSKKAQANPASRSPTPTPPFFFFFPFWDLP